MKKIALIIGLVALTGCASLHDQVISACQDNGGLKTTNVHNMLVFEDAPDSHCAKVCGTYSDYYLQVPCKNGVTQNIWIGETEYHSGRVEDADIQQYNGMPSHTWKYSGADQ